MSRRQQAERTTFAARTKRRRKLHSIHKKHGHLPSYVGATTGFTFNCVKHGPGAFFFEDKS